MKSETLAWVIVGAIVVLFFVGRKNRKTVAATCAGYPVQSSPSPAGGDTIAGGGTIAAGTPEQIPPAGSPTPHYCNHILVGQFPIDKYPVPVLNPVKPIITPVYPLRCGLTSRVRFGV